MNEPSLAPPVWVDRQAALGRMIDKLARCSILAVDTESNSLYVYREQVCLIQFSTPDEDYLVDSLVLRDLSALRPVFADPNVEKIFHAAEYDLIGLKRDFDFRFANLFDTMIAARVLGRTAVGLGSLLEAEFGILVDKRFQRANWGLRPLPQPQLDYARMDTHHLVRLRDRLKTELETSGRWPLALEDFQRVTQVNGKEPDDWEQTCWRIQGVHDLNGRQAAVLRELCHYRDNQARSANLPPFKILSSQALLEIAQILPQKMAELDEVKEINARQIQRHGARLLEAVARGMQAPPARPPVSPRPDDAYLNRLDALRSWRKVTAAQMGVESDVVLPRDVLYAIAAGAPAGLDELAANMSHAPYRFQLFGPQIMKAIHGN
ncbi:MAG TPA: HRDC domain-containing protein [Anaerolineaceae bacterium]|nr:HRDC domain-containing protein [Anaerolineaceae bacterium]